MREERAGVRSWASIVEPEATVQARRTAALPILAGPVALMPDAHLGIGATVGSVIATEGAIVPSAVGVDIGCGMIAVRTDVTAAQLPDDLSPFVDAIGRVVPAGVGRGHEHATDAARAWFAANPNDRLAADLTQTALKQFGTMGSGNHFFEVCLDETDTAWVMMHSGSRGVGNRIASRAIEVSKEVARAAGLDLADPELAWLTEGSEEFRTYIADMRWSQAYAMANRTAMMHAALAAISQTLGRDLRGTRWVNCHHNFAEVEEHGGRRVWVTRKGAIRAERGDWGVIPGAMGVGSYVVRGLANELAYRSAPHGAGRSMSRTRARRELTVDSFVRSMAHVAWQRAAAEALLDEHPDSYKPLDVVIADSADLVEVVHHLRGIANYKGVDRGERRGRRGRGGRPVRKGQAAHGDHG